MRNRLSSLRIPLAGGFAEGERLSIAYDGAQGRKWETSANCV